MQPQDRILAIGSPSDPQVPFGNLTDDVTDAIASGKIEDQGKPLPDTNSRQQRSYRRRVRKANAYNRAIDEVLIPSQSLMPNAKVLFEIAKQRRLDSVPRDKKTGEAIGPATFQNVIEDGEWK